MAVTRRIGNLTIHFLGDNAEQLASMFDDAHSRSQAFRRDMGETSRTHRNIFVGSALADLEDQPDFANAGFDPASTDLKDKPAFGKAAGAETHFIVVKPGSHGLFHDNQRFDGSAQLALIHELLHPSQMIRELAQNGTSTRDSERQTQIREQRVAVELGMVPGREFPDVIGSEAPYDARRDESQLHSLPSERLPVAPMRYFAPERRYAPQPDSTEDSSASDVSRYVRFGSGIPSTGLLNRLIPVVAPNSEETLSAPNTKPVRYLSGRFSGSPQPSDSDDRPAAPPLVPLMEDFDLRQAIDDNLEGGILSNPAYEPRDMLRSETTPQTKLLLGLVSGEPMSFYPVQPPIFGFPEPGMPKGEDWLVQLLAPRGRK